jgi:hypothetical protein
MRIDEEPGPLLSPPASGSGSGSGSLSESKPKWRIRFELELELELELDPDPELAHLDTSPTGNDFRVATSSLPSQTFQRRRRDRQ